MASAPRLPLLPLLPVLVVVQMARANMLDLIQPLKLRPSECPRGCARWGSLAEDGCSGANQTAVDSMWAAGAPPSEAENHCAQPGRSLTAMPGENYTDGWNNSSPWGPDMSKPGAYGAFCYCAHTDGPTNWGYCQSARLTPEQINIQLSSPTSVVVAFVTFGDININDGQVPPPVAQFWVTGEKAPNHTAGLINGVSTVYDTDAVPYNKAGRDSWKPQPERLYSMHFVRLNDLTPGTSYEYRVRSAKSQWSAQRTFRFGNFQKFAMFGDMGVFEWNNIGNLLGDAKAEDIDAVLMLGDHCYNLGMGNMKRGDGYMDAFEPVISQIPWLPVIGNHEYYDGHSLYRYVNQTDYEAIMPVLGAMGSQTVPERDHYGGRSTATTPLGHLLSFGTHHAAGNTGSVPSGTSRYYSVDLGFVHFIALDLNMYAYTAEPYAPYPFAAKPQLDWLEADLKAANANRDSVPWVLLTSHYPLYCSTCANIARANISAVSWVGPEFGDGVGGPLTAAQPGEQTASAMLASMLADLEPLMLKYGVDIYAAGHQHQYESMFPVKHGQPTATNFVDPVAPVHFLTGNGGPPGIDLFGMDPARGHGKAAPFSNTRSLKFGYGKVHVPNATHFIYEQVANGYLGDTAGEVVDRVVVTQTKHGRDWSIESGLSEH